MKVGLKCVRIPELKYAHLCSESTNLSLRMTFSDSNMTLKLYQICIGEFMWHHYSIATMNLNIRFPQLPSWSLYRYVENF